MEHRFALAEVYIALHKEHAALEHLLLLIQKDPNQIAVREAYVKSLLQCRQFDLYREEYEKILQINPENPKFSYDHLYHEIVDHNSNNLHYLNELSEDLFKNKKFQQLFCLAKALRNCRLFEPAEVILKNLYSCFPQDASIALEFGLLLMDKGDSQQFWTFLNTCQHKEIIPILFKRLETCKGELQKNLQAEIREFWDRTK